MLILMSISITMSTLFLFMKHPLSMGFILLVQSSVISMITGMYNHNFWFSYILFLIMIGGMLVLFIYMTSIASNEMFKYSNKLMTLTAIMILMLTLMQMFMDKLIINMNMFSTDLTMLNQNHMFNLTLSKYLNPPSSIILTFIIIYLLISLIAVVKITNIKHGPLRQKH
uniref:NADH-ubiquinone oxidoreductase chain 6 n=1 Tax=Simianus niponicus TaxID=3107951 RepID=A0A343A4I0_9COLE|nr:NADH dehydrogenase subunit 6 [Simianus niponicus]AOY39458.1 NADH dehydrogenase subunit 6 [Simianus niponicus]